MGVEASSNGPTILATVLGGEPSSHESPRPGQRLRQHIRFLVREYNMAARIVRRTGCGEQDPICLRLLRASRCFADPL